jgi:two-component system, NarL family, response regulator DesR
VVDELRLTVISDEAALADVAAAALERDGFGVTLQDLGGRADPLRRPSVAIVRRAGDQRGLVQSIQNVRQRVPGALVVVALPAGKCPDVGLLLAVGADALVFEREVADGLGAVVRGLLAGQLSIPAELRQVIRPPALSHRERQILGLSVAGLTNMQIANRLHLSESTVKSHLSAAFRRLRVHSRREAAALVFASDDGLRRTLLSSFQLADVVSARENR